jgi:hypothetical protein
VGNTAGVAVSVSDLINDLDDPSGAGEDAKCNLIARGVEIVAELAARIGTLGRFGKLLAIEALETLGDPRACPALIDLLAAGEDDTVVAWSAEALASLGCREAVEPLQRALSRSVAAHTPPDWTRPLFLRSALTDLGAREPVLPSVTARLQQRHKDGEMRLFASRDLPTVVDDLAAHGQVVLGFTLWRIDADGHLYGAPAGHADWDFSWSIPWAENVTAARRAALTAATAAGPSLLAHIDWIDESDVAAGMEGGT